MLRDKQLDEILRQNLDQYRPLAFFGINIEQSQDNIVQWVKWCKQQGFRGFNIIVGSGCDGRAHAAWIEKLLNAYEIAITTAAAEDLEVWIFDDWGYPSGTAGGLVCTNPEYRLKRLDITHDCMVDAGDTIELRVPERFVAGGILAGRGDYRSLELTAGEYFTYTASKPVRLVIVGWNYDPHQAKSSCKSYPGDPAMSCIDMLNPQAVRRFIEVMHKRYYQRFKEYMGSVIKGFFYDEPYLPYEFPWTEQLPEVFKLKKGYDLIPILPELLAKVHTANRGPIVQYTDDFFDVWTDMAAANYYGEMSKWCEEHGLQLSGHMDLDHHLNTMSTISGHFYKNLRYNHRPAVDVIWAQIAPGEFSDFPRYAGSIKYLLGRKMATSETFAGMGLGLSGDLMRFITDHEVIRGINDFHLMYSSNKPPVHEASPQMPNHMLQEPFGKHIYRRIAAAATVASIGLPRISTALYLPAYDFNRAQLGLRRVGITNAEKLPWQWVNEISEYLTYLPIDFCYLWQEALLELEIGQGGLVTKGGNTIDTIIIPPGTTIREVVEKKLKQFIAEGGRVIAVFKPIWSLMEQAIMCNEIQDLKKYVACDVKIVSSTKISLCTRKIEGQVVYMFLNETNEQARALIRFNQKVESVYRLSLSEFNLEKTDSQNIDVIFEPKELKVYLADDAGIIQHYQLPRVLAEPIKCCNWRIHLPDGAVENLESDQFPDWENLGYPEFSGSITYTAEFEWNSAAGSALIRADRLFSHAVISIDGMQIGKMAYRPYEITVNDIDRGVHELKIDVYNTEANRMCGTLKIERERYHGRFAHLANYDRRRIQSGLLKPVTIYPF